MAISETIELLGKGCYKNNIPDTITLTSIPTASELDYVGSEDFEQVMLDNILPKAVKEDIPFRELLEIDFQWICRCLRILNYGPYHTTNAILCDQCGQTSFGGRIKQRGHRKIRLRSHTDIAQPRKRDISPRTDQCRVESVPHRHTLQKIGVTQGLSHS